MANTREMRTIRIEDWEGNVYRPEGVGSGGGSSGVVLSPSQNDTIITDGTIVEDPDSNGSAIILPSGTEDKTLANVTIEDLIFGDYSITTRLKCSANTNANNVISIQTYYTLGTEDTDVLLSTTYLTGTDFETANTYQSFVMITDFKGIADSNKKMKVVMKVLKNTGVTVSFDYVCVIMASGTLLNKVTTRV